MPDLKAGSDFYGAFGLNERATDGKALMFRCDGRDHDEVVITETGQRRKFQHLSFAADADGLKAVEANLKARGVATEPPPEPETPSA